MDQEFGVKVNDLLGLCQFNREGVLARCKQLQFDVRQFQKDHAFPLTSFNTDGAPTMKFAIEVGEERDAG